MQVDCFLVLVGKQAGQTADRCAHLPLFTSTSRLCLILRNQIPVPLFPASAGVTYRGNNKNRAAAHPSIDPSPRAPRPSARTSFGAPSVFPLSAAETLQ